MRRVLVLLAFLLTAVPARAGHLSLDDLRRANLLRPAPPLKPVAVPPLPTTHVVGDARAFWTYDLSVMPPKNKQVATTCRAVGETVAVYVADSEWPQKVDPSDVDAVVAAFDVDTPLGDGVGITARNTDLFGASSDLDGDGKLIVFIYPIAGYQGNTFDGFFRPEDLAAFQAGCATNPMLYCSNEAEMVHVNSTNPGSPYMIGVMAHEFQHLLHYVADPNEESWINEAMSELAMSASGYEDTGNLHAYLGNPSAPLETSEFVDYGAVMLWGTWLYERFGAEFVRALVAEPANGRAGLAATWSTLGLTVTYEDTFADAALAAVLDGPGALGYALLDLPHVNPSGALPALVGGEASGSLTVPPSAYRWLQGQIPADRDLTVAIPAGSDVRLRVASYIAGASTLAGQDDPATWTLPAASLAAPVVVLIANPTLSAKTVEVTFRQVAAAEPEPEPQPEVAPDVVDSSDVALADLAGPELEANTHEPDAPSADDLGATDDTGATVEADDAGSGACAYAEAATPGALPLLLSTLVLLLARRRT